MAEIVNLRRERKKRARAEKERTAEQNRMVHGRTKAERLLTRAVADKSSAFLEGHRRESENGEGSEGRQ